MEAIADLQVAGESRDGYEREKFEHWSDADGVIRSRNLGHAVSTPDSLGGHVYVV